MKKVYREITYRELIPRRGSTKLDNYTDALMLLNAENERTESIWIEALNVSRLTAAEYNPMETLVSLHSREELDYKITSYGRYWHGYLVYLKPLMMIFNYQQIRYILIFVQMPLVFILMYFVFFLNPIVCDLSLQFTPVICLTLAQMIAILMFEEKYKTCMKLWMYHFLLLDA